jgi:hypothetical protein
MLIKSRWFRPMWDGDGSGGGGTPPPAPAPAPAPAGDPQAGVQALIARHNNDLTAVIHHLFNDNYSLRDKNRGLREQVKELESKAPKEDAVVLSADEARLLESYKALGTPEEIKKAQGELETARTEAVTLRRDRVIAEAAKAHQFKDGVLKKLVENDKLTIEMRETEKDGQKKPVAFVIPGDAANGAVVALDEFAAKHWTDFLPSLRVEAEQGGTRFVQQNPGNGAATGDIVSKFIEDSQKARDSQPNPLKK